MYWDMLSNSMSSRFPCCDVRYDFRVRPCSIRFEWEGGGSYLYLFMYTGVQHDFHIGWCSSGLTETRRVSHVEQYSLILSECISSPPCFSVLLDLCRSLFVLFNHFLYHCVVCPSSIYIFWLPLWYLQTLLNKPVCSFAV